jgi:[ribosomal protein S5]-alanine N-acetyltransferase
MASSLMQIPRLQSARLTLRPYRPSDFDSFVSLNLDANVRRHVGGTLDFAKAKQLFDQFVIGECSPGHEAWAVTQTDSGNYIGHCWFVIREGTDCPELGFLFDQRYWRQGYGTELANALMMYGLAGYPRLVATVDSDHVPSIRVLERAGMKRERIERDAQGIYFVYSTMPCAKPTAQIPAQLSK